MLHYGFTIGQIEMSLGIDDNTIFRYAKAYKEKALRGIWKMVMCRIQAS